MGESGSSTQTMLTQVGRGGESSLQYVNPPIVRGTTVLAQTLEQWRQRAKLPFNAKPQANYGRFGTLTTAAFESAIAELEGAYKSFCFPSGLAACTHSLLAVCKPGSHVLLTDFVYWPLREFAENVLTQLGVEVEFFTSQNTADVLSRFKENTCALYLEAPGSISFEMCEVDELAYAAHQRGAIVLMDNTWATPLLFKPLEHGVDISIQSVSKYIGGHSDCIMGVASCTEKAWELLSNSVTRFGQTASPDDLYQALRGLRTLDVRLRQHGQSALSVARWLEAQPEVQRVCCPGLESHPGHATFKRLFRGVSGLFSFVFEPMPEEKLAMFFNSLRIVGIGLSWGGFESLVVPLVARPASQIHDDYPKEGQLVRIHVGLENIEDLINDLQQAFVLMRHYEPKTEHGMV